jgi:hypothetical protein
MPVVTVLRAKHGVVTDFSVNPSPWPVDMPPLPAELLARPVAEKKPAPAPAQPKVQPVMAPSLILSGRKQATSPPPAVQVTTNALPAAGKSGASALPFVPPVQDAGTNAEPAVTMERATATKPGNAESAARSQETGATGAPRVQTLSPAAEHVQIAQSSTANPEAKPPSAATQTLLPTITRTATPQAAASAPPVVAAASTEAMGPPPTPQPAQLVSPRASAAASSATAPTAQASSPAQGGVPAAPPPAQNAVAVALEPFFAQKTFWALGIAALCIITAGVFLLLRRRRSAAQASLITRSFERGAK